MKRVKIRQGTPITTSIVVAAFTYDRNTFTIFYSFFKVRIFILYIRWCKKTPQILWKIEVNEPFEKNHQHSRHVIEVILRSRKRSKYWSLQYVGRMQVTSRRIQKSPLSKISNSERGPRICKS